MLTIFTLKEKWFAVSLASNSAFFGGGFEEKDRKPSLEFM